MTEIGAHSLSDLLSGGIYALILVLARIGTAFAFFPGFGDTYVNSQTRMLISLAISFVLLPALWPLLPAMPKDISSLVALFGHEVVWGFFLGITARLMMMALDMAGILIATNTGLSAATSFNPALASAGPIVTSFLTMSAILVLFATNLHHMLIESLVQSYTFFKVSDPLPVADITQTAVEIISHATKLGFQLAAPFVVMGLVFNVGLGLLARLVPQMQVFLIGLPVQVMVGLTLLSLILMTMIQLWLAHFQSAYFGLFH